MTQPSRTTESISRDNAAIRDIMHRIRELTVPDRATLALGLIGHLATVMNRSQMSRLLDELREETERVQDVPPVRQHDMDQRTGEAARETPRAAGGGGRADERSGGDARSEQARSAGSTRRSVSDRAHEGVGQAGRGEFRPRRIV